MDFRAIASPAGPQAYTTCAKAKAKCIPLPSLDLCERCRRLRKPCFPQTPASTRKRARKRKQAVKKLSRVEALEGRIEELSSRLAAVDGNNMTAGSRLSTLSERAPSPNVTIETHRDPIASHGAWLESGQPSISPLESIHPVSRISSQPPFLKSAEVLRQTQQSVMKAQTREAVPENNSANTLVGDRDIVALLCRYRTHMQHRFLFVIIPQELSNKAERLRRPFLWRAVKVAALWQEHARHIKLGKRLLSELVDAILLRSLKSFDVIQGLLVFIAWYHFNLDKSQLTNLLGLLQSLCLSLNFGQNSLTRSFGKVQARNVGDDILDQTRAYCGFYYLSAIVFTMSGKPETCPQTHLIDQLCDNLSSQERQRPTDKWLVALVKVERLAQSIEVMKISWKTGGYSGVSLNIIVLGFQQQISLLKESFSDDLIADHFLQRHLLAVDMILYEVAIRKNSFDTSPSQNGRTGQAGARPIGNFLDSLEMQQANTKDNTDLLKACLASVKAFLANHLSHVDVYMNLSYISSFDITYCLKLCRCLKELRGMIGWESDTTKSCLSLDDALLKRRVEDLMNLAIENNRFETSQISPIDGDEDDAEDAELLSIRRELNIDTTRDPFQSIADNLKSLLSLFSGEEGEGDESLAASGIATPNAHYENPAAGGQNQGGDTMSAINTRSDIGGQEPRSVESHEETEPFWQTAGPITSPSRERTGGERSAVSLIKDGSSSQMLAIPTEAPYFFPGGGFSQISFWPRLVRKEDEN